MNKNTSNPFFNSKAYKKESGQALIGGICFVMFIIIGSYYFVTVSNSMRGLYAATLKDRFTQIKETSEQANILNEIAINNQNIMASLITAQKAYISGIETGLTIAYEQPYWDTYASDGKEDGSILSQKSMSAIEKSFDSYALASARGFYVAKALAFKNQLLVHKLPPSLWGYFSQSTNAYVQCLALEFQKSELNRSHYVRFLAPTIYPLGVTKTNCALEHLSTVIIDFNKIDEYFSQGKKFSYGISYVKPELAREFINALKHETSSCSKSSEACPLKSTVRISHPQFSCKDKLDLKGAFTIEEDWANNCEISVPKFIKSFFKPNWTAFVTEQETGLKTNGSRSARSRIEPRDDIGLVRRY